MDRQQTSQAAVTAVPRQQTALWIIAILLAIIATAVVVRSPDVFGVPQAFGGDAPVPGARGVYAFTGQLAENRYGLFMMDVEAGNIWCYEYLPGTRKLMLVAARTYRYDRYLEDYNNDKGTNPEAVQALLHDQNRIKERINGGEVSPATGDEDLGTEVPGLPYYQEPTDRDQRKKLE
ncbi:MAG TPA: hypothetical protein VMV94_06480 [Phycisphaerae bacterium]|nr:hypothetical protein [Phycisphaerae bacterium]